MSTPKPAKSDSYSVKFSDKTGGAYAEMKAVIQSESKNWGVKGDRADSCKTNGNKDPKADNHSKKK